MNLVSVCYPQILKLLRIVDILCVWICLLRLDLERMCDDVRGKFQVSSN